MSTEEQQPFRSRSDVVVSPLDNAVVVTSSSIKDDQEKVSRQVRTIVKSVYDEYGMGFDCDSAEVRHYHPMRLLIMIRFDSFFKLSSHIRVVMETFGTYTLRFQKRKTEGSGLPLRFLPIKV